jgi:hypothetical protein
VHSRELDRIAPISDVHGNRTALEAVLADIDAGGITGICNLGDHSGKGHRGREVIDLCRERCGVDVLGRWDDRLPHPARELDNASLRWWLAQLANTPATGAGPVPDVVGYADTHDPCYGYADGTYDLDTCYRVPRS